MATIQCFMLVRTGRTVRSLRRFTWADPEDLPRCPGMGYHNASVRLDVVEGDPAQGSSDYWPHNDPRWPTRCDSCPFVFCPTDPWQVFHETEYQVEGTGELCTLRTARVGAMWLADWMTSHGSKRHQARGGGPHLIVKTPAGDWDVDGPSTNGDGWDRTGAPPHVTVRPSIGFQDAKGGWRFHAFLTDGQLVEC